jgi:hypothetical protein
MVDSHNSSLKPTTQHDVVDCGLSIAYLVMLAPGLPFGPGHDSMVGDLLSYDLAPLLDPRKPYSRDTGQAVSTGISRAAG